MAVILEQPERPGREPVVVVPVENNRGVIADTSAAEQCFEMFFVDWGAHHLVLQLFLPVESDRAGYMSLLVGFRINIDLDQAHIWIVQVGLDPISIYQRFRVRVTIGCRHDYSFTSS